MDMAIEIETRADHVAAICDAIPPQYRIGAADSLQTIEASLAAMAGELARQSSQIAALQLRLTDATISARGQLENIPLSDLLRTVQSYIEHDTALEIEADGMWVLFDGESYQATPDDALELLDAVGLLARTVVR